ncbi:MAG: transglutaminase domain-containing protein [Planctomycetaceae bacterium]|nr:transglutaminase domain-containing protein [Planctomycetaceae bacterium]
MIHRIRVGLLIVAAGMLALHGLPVDAAFAQRPQTAPAEIRLGEEHTEQYRVGMVITAKSGPCREITGSIPFPVDWPEQHVKVVSEDISASVREVAYRDLGTTVLQMFVHIPYLAAGEEAHAIVTLEVTRKRLLPPADTSSLVIPEKLDKATRVFLGASPGIEIKQAKIKAVAKETLKQHADAPAWQQVEALYDWVRSNVTYKAGKFKGAAAALKTKIGDCEDMTALFVALCRNIDVPARTVWVPGHCYPEFYLEDASGQGHWFPCQIAGERAFGEMPDSRPILQKGDNFQVPERSDRQRFVAEHLTGAGGKPSVKFVRESALVGG